MIPNNNLSVLPWYASIEEQNARRWWVYKRVYPLFTPAGYLPPFQLLREHLISYTKGNEISSDDYDNGVLTPDGHWDSTGSQFGIHSFESLSGVDAVYFEGIPETAPLMVTAVALNDNNDVLGTFTAQFDESGLFSGGWVLPTGTTKLWVQDYNADYPDASPKLYAATTSTAGIESFAIYTKEGELVGNYDPSEMGFSIVPFLNLGYDVIVFPGQLPVLGNFENGQYYAVMSDGTNTWYSEIFTVVNDISPYLKLEWWDAENFVMDAGTIVYKNPSFKNVLYLDATIAKPEYRFEEEGEERDGYFFPTKQISEKRYRFAFFASEYLLDVLRFVRMADFAQITKNGQVYSLDTFLITPEWESNGDVAGVTAEFDTATVAKKIGTGYIKALRGDFNDDFNNDFDI